MRLRRATPTTHDYTLPMWGHDLSLRTTDGGMHCAAIGWGNGIEKGDHLILRNGDGTSRYRVQNVEYSINPKDMWTATLIFAPRTKAEKGE